MIHIQVSDAESSAFKGLIDKSSRDFHQLMDYWETLSRNEKDTCSHPVYMADFLKYKNDINSNFRLVSVYEGDSCIAMLPIEIMPVLSGLPFLYYVRVITVASGSPVAFKAGYHQTIIETLLYHRFQKNRKPLMVVFGEIDDTNVTFTVDMPKIVVRNVGSRKVFNLPANPDELKFPSTIKKKLKRISKIGELDIQVFEDIQGISDAYDEITELEGKGWKGRIKSSLDNNKFAWNFYKLLLLDFAQLKSASILKMQINNQPLAMFAGIIIEQRYFGLLITYNEEYSYYSPGHLLLYHIFKEYLPARGVTSYDSLFKSEWFSLWKPAKCTASKILIFPGRGSRLFASMVLFAKHVPRTVMTSLNHRFKHRNQTDTTADETADTSC